MYGHILQKMPLVLSKGEPYQWEYVNPFALVYQYSCLRPRFGDMLKAAANEAGFARIVFYMDEATPGNVLRPDAGRTLACFYWSFMELPSWFRSRQCGCFFFGMFPLALVEHLPGGYASLFTSMVKTFFGKALLQWDFSVSGIACRSTGGGFLFKARFGALLSDEKAMKELWCTKGASSYKPCHLCKNVMGRLDVPPEHPYLVHYTCVDAAQFDLHTPETFREMARQLQEAYTAMSQKRFEKLEQCYGLKYVPLGVLWCEELQDICDPCLPHVLGLDAYFDGVWRYCAVLFQSIYSLFVQSGHYFADTGCVCSRNCLAERCLLVKKVLPKAGGQRGRRAPEGFCKRTVSGDGYSYSFHTTGCGPRWNFAAGNGVCGAHGENHYHSVIPRSCAFKTGCA